MRHARQQQAILLCMALLALAAAGFLDYPYRCPLNYLTGLQCPGCGAQRMAYHLLHGEWAAAYGSNALLLLALPYSVLGVLLDFWLPRRSVGGCLRNAFYGKKAYAIALVVVALFTCYRNM